jgi:hypothetical protein
LFAAPILLATDRRAYFASQQIIFRQLSKFAGIPFHLWYTSFKAQARRSKKQNKITG